MTEPVAANPAEPRNNRWLRLALGLSLALNLGVLGVVGGALLKGHEAELRPSMVRDLGFGPFSEALTPQDRDVLRRAFLQGAADFRANRRAMRADFTALLAVLRSPAFDAAALSAALDRQTHRAADRLALGQKLLADHIATMTPAARSAFADRLEASLSHRSMVRR